MKPCVFTLQQIAEFVGGTVRGDLNYKISGIATLQSANKEDISFLANPAYQKHLSETDAGAVILHEKAADGLVGHVIIHDNPYLAYARLTQMWAAQINSAEVPGIHVSAVVAEDALIGEGVSIAAGAIISSGVTLGDGVRVGENCTVGADSVIGAESLLHAGVNIYHGVSIGQRCIIHSGVVIGSDGFGFAPHQGAWEKIAQLGGVVIEDDVEIGANSAIDRGALDNTVIERGVKLDNQIQIAHNVRIGQNTAIAACSAVAGSTTIGKNCIVGGASGIAGHLNITDNVHITAMTMVIKSLSEPGVYSSGTGVQPNAQWKKSIARLRQLDKMAGRLKAVEKALAEK